MAVVEGGQVYHEGQEGMGAVQHWMQQEHLHHHQRKRESSNLHSSPLKPFSVE
jgi:hypothetical protein